MSSEKNIENAIRFIAFPNMIHDRTLSMGPQSEAMAGICQQAGGFCTPGLFQKNMEVVWGLSCHGTVANKWGLVDRDCS